MITGFNPADMYAADHIRRVLQTFPGVFSGIGEFTIHKEFVSSKIAGDVASLTDPALDRILDFAAEAGLVVILHNDIDMPFPKPEQEPYDARAAGGAVPAPSADDDHLGALRRRPHRAAGRRTSSALVERALADPALAHVYIDISWDEIAKYIVATPGVDRARGRAASTATRTASCSAPTRWRRPTRRATSRSTTCTRRCSRALTPEASEKLRQGQLRAAVRRGAREGAGMGSAARA